MRTIAPLPLVLGALSFFACGKKDEHQAQKSPPPRLEPNEVIASAAPATDLVSYELSFADAAHHYVHVRASYPTPANVEIDLSMPVWTPGSYLVREYARNVEEVKASSSTGEALPFAKTSKNRWHLRTGARAGIVVEYKVYCREVSVRTNFVDSDFAIVNGAPTFMRLDEDAPRAHEVRVLVPEGWKPAVSALASSEANHFRAASYDELIDSPIVAGSQLSISSFDVQGVAHRLVQLGDDSHWDSAEVTADLGDLVKAEQHFWGVVPYTGYSFLNVLLGGGGGLEHLDSTLMLASPFAPRKAERYRSWLALVAHEFFHAWNVKRLRPAALGPFDYDNENYTDSLWIAEGITTYYADLLLKRAGFLDQEQFLDHLSEQIRSTQTAPGRAVQTLSQASRDAWIKYYRRDENTANTAISYYSKGAVVAFLLDAEIRRATGSAKSLDDLMRLMYSRYSGDKGYTPEDFRQAASELAGTDLSYFFASALDSTEELDYAPALELFGLELTGAGEAELEGDDHKDSEQDDESEDEPAGWLGASMQGDKVSAVLRDTPAYASGLNVDDELVAIDGYRSFGDADGLLGRFTAGQKVTLTISRHGRLRELAATLGEPPKPMWSLQVSKGQNQLEAERMRQWLAEYEL